MSPVVHRHRSYGAKERALDKAPGRLEAALRTNGVDHDVKVCAEAWHPFLDDHDPAEVSIIFKVPAKLSGSGSQEASARDARSRIIAFFNEYVR